VKNAAEGVFKPVEEISAWTAAPAPEEVAQTPQADEWQAPVFKPAAPATPPAPEAPVSAAGPVPPAAAAPAQKKFPTWAIILIVLLVLCLCGSIGVLIVTNIFRSAMNGASLLIPFLM